MRYFHGAEMLAFCLTLQLKLSDKSRPAFFPGSCYWQQQQQQQPEAAQNVNTEKYWNAFGARL